MATKELRAAVKAGKVHKGMTRAAATALNQRHRQEVRAEMDALRQQRAQEEGTAGEPLDQALDQEEAVTLSMVTILSALDAYPTMPAELLAYLVRRNWINYDGTLAP